MEYKKFEKHVASTLRKEEMLLDIDQLIVDIHASKPRKRRGAWFILFGLMSLGLVGWMSYSAPSINENTNISYEEVLVKTPENNMASEQSITNVSVSTNSDNSRFEQENIASEFQDQLNIATIAPQKTSQSNQLKQTNHIEKTNLPHKAFSSTTSTESNPLSGAYFTNYQKQDHSNQNTTVRSTIDFIGIANKKFQSLSIPQRSIGHSGIRKINCPTFGNSHRISIALVPEVGVFLPMKQLTNTSPENNTVFGLREKDEISLEGLSAGLFAQVRMENIPIYVKVGASMSRLTEQMRLNYAYTRQDTSRGIISITQSQTGDTITAIYGDIITERKFSGNKTRHYTLSLADLHVGIGTEKRMGNWFAGIEGGAILNVSLSSSGSILATDTSFVGLDLVPNQFKGSIGWSYYGALSVGRDFSEHSRAYLSLQARMNPSSFSTDAGMTRQSYDFVGLNIGYVHSF